MVTSPTNGSSHPEQVDFDLQSRASAQALYRTVTEFHTFFKRDGVSRVVKTAGFCKSLLGNFKGQNPDRFYFDVVRTHREVIDHVWAILHPSTRFMHGDDNGGQGSSSGSNRSAGNSGRRGYRNNHRTPGGNGSRSLDNNTNPEPSDSTAEPAPPLPPPSRHMQRGGSLHGRGSGNMQRSHSVQDSGLRPPNFTHLPPLPPYSQRSCSSDILMRGTSGSVGRRPHLRANPAHGPNMASVATFNPYFSPTISETGSDGEEDAYMGGSECYVTMSSRSDASHATYLPSTMSDPGTTGRSRAYNPLLVGGGGSNGGASSSNTDPPPMPGSDTSGAPSDLYMTSVDSECSEASYRVNSPPPLYREVDEEHSVPINFDHIPTSGGSGLGVDPTPDSAAISLVSPIIPIASSETGSAVFDFDAAAVLTRTQELEGELQRLRAAMTCRLCKQNPIGATFCPCGHTVCCYQCAQRMHSCWECDEVVTSVQRMLLTR